MADCVLMANADCCADELLGVLRELPGVVAVAGLPLSSILFECARGRVREYRRAVAVGGSRSGRPADEVWAGLSAGREMLDAILQEARSRARCRHVVLHDARALAFPLADVAGIKVIELVRERVPGDSEARNAIRASLGRLRGPERFRNAAGYLRVDQERLQDARATVAAEISAFLDAPAGDAPIPDTPARAAGLRGLK